MRAAIESADATALKQSAYEIQLAQLGKKRFDDDLLRMLLDLYADPQVHALKDASAILEPLDFDADKLTSRQRRAVVEALERVYPFFLDRLTQFYITEFVGRKFADEHALWLFNRLMTVGDPGARALVAHGLEHLVCAGSGGVARKAFTALLSLVHDQADEVITEALLSLERIVRANGILADEAQQLLASFANHERATISEVARGLIAHIMRMRDQRPTA